MSIATKQGDGGRTALPGGTRVSKADPRVECYGTVDELVSQMGFARSICRDAGIRESIRNVQRDLYKVGGAIAMPAALQDRIPDVSAAMLDGLDAEIRRIESQPGVLADWSLPGDLPDSAALDVARTVCRRAERLATGLMEKGEIGNALIVAYLNRLSDLLWLWGRLVEAREGLDSSLRSGGEAGGRWSRAW